MTCTVSTYDTPHAAARRLAALLMDDGPGSIDDPKTPDVGEAYLVERVLWSLWDVALSPCWFLRTVQDGVVTGWEFSGRPPHPGDDRPWVRIDGPGLVVLHFRHAAPGESMAVAARAGLLTAEPNLANVLDGIDADDLAGPPFLVLGSGRPDPNNRYGVSS